MGSTWLDDNPGLRIARPAIWYGETLRKEPVPINPVRLAILLIPAALACSGHSGNTSFTGDSGDQGNGASTEGSGYIDVTVSTQNPVATSTTYLVSISNGQKKSVDANGSVSFKTNRTGTFEVTISSVPAACTLSGDNPVVVSVRRLHHHAVTFTITCPGSQ
jgi:hypothetical protein